ncbi:MAG: polyprenol monophosphomannose synthase [Spirochaetes bacterium]|nr:polyprenol monophosphomannose synthase [Spirochaetota bacterium]
MEKTLIIIPTYNEKDNIEDLIFTVFQTVKKFPADILVIDDNSPDGTGDIIANLMKKQYSKRLFLIKRKSKMGLGTAYIKGFKWGLERDYDIFIEMDADFSHNPSYLPAMLKQSRSYDFIIGSRYVKYGGVEGWTNLRKFISRGGSLYAKTILFCPIRDLTGGYNLWKREVLKSIDLDNIISEGYSFQIEMKYRAFKKGYLFYEFPIIFEDRTIGQSKMSRKIVLEAIIAVWKLKIFLG